MNQNNGQQELDESCLEIDSLALDKEWVEQPSLYFKWARKLALARNSFDEAKAELELVQAELDSSIRESPSEYDIPKLTDKAVEAKIPQQGEYQKALKAFHTAKKRMNLCDAMVEALEHRKRSLEKLVDLHISEYYSTPRASGDASHAMADVEKRAARTKKRRKQLESDD